MTYLITFNCYGCHLHGDDSGSVDPTRNRHHSPAIPPTPKLAQSDRRNMDQPPYNLDAPRRALVLSSLHARCSTQSWNLLAAHVRTTHVHLVVEADIRPERILNDLKSWVSRNLNGTTLDLPGRKRWARHGSTRWLWTQESISSAIQYVLTGQGTPMSVYPPFTIP